MTIHWSIHVETFTKIAENVFIMTNITIYYSTDIHFKGFNEKVNNESVSDEFTMNYFWYDSRMSK